MKSLSRKWAMKNVMKSHLIANPKLRQRFLQQTSANYLIKLGFFFSSQQWCCLWHKIAKVLIEDNNVQSCLLNKTTRLSSFWSVEIVFERPFFSNLPCIFPRRKQTFQKWSHFLNSLEDYELSSNVSHRQHIRVVLQNISGW